MYIKIAIWKNCLSSAVPISNGVILNLHDIQIHFDLLINTRTGLHNYNLRRYTQ